MKVTRLVALSVLFAVASAPAVDARPRPAGHTNFSKFEANKTFGLGLELGSPDGINGKYFLSSSNALDFGLGYAYRNYYAGDGLNLYVDYLWHPFVLATADAFELPFYIGVGGHFWRFDWGCDRFGNCADYGEAFGVRVPIGIAFDFNEVPLDIFLQVVPTFDFFSHYNGHDPYLGFWGSVGIRFWFN